MKPVTELGTEPTSWHNGLLGANPAGAGASAFLSEKRQQV